MAKVAQAAFYIDNGLTGADTVQEVIQLREQLQQLFSRACFRLRKWNSSEPPILDSIPSDFREVKEILSISDSGTGIAKIVGIHWNTKSDTFLLATSELKQAGIVTKRISRVLADMQTIHSKIGALRGLNTIEDPQMSREDPTNSDQIYLCMNR